MISNYDHIEPVRQVKRFKKGEGKVNIGQPLLYGNYNDRMKGVDETDGSINCYRCSIQGKCWYWRIVIYLFDLVVSNT